MLNVIVILVVGVAIPALLVFAVTFFDMIRDEHPHRRATDH